MTPACSVEEKPSDGKHVEPLNREASGHDPRTDPLVSVSPQCNGNNHEPNSKITRLHDFDTPTPLAMAPSSPLAEKKYSSRKCPHPRRFALAGDDEPNDEDEDNNAVAATLSPSPRRRGRPRKGSNSSEITTAHKKRLTKKDGKNNAAPVQLRPFRPREAKRPKLS
ncbi:hypothetical protein ACA910_018858 [Epithemia clementina (nom. ined.)]